MDRASSGNVAVVGKEAKMGSVSTKLSHVVCAVIISRYMGGVMEGHGDGLCGVA